MEEQNELSEELSEEELAYKALSAKIKLIKWQYNGIEKEVKTFTKKDYIQLIIVIVICLCVVVVWALFAA